MYAVSAELFVAYLRDLKCNLMESLPERLPVGQVTLKSYLPDLKIYLSWTTGRDFCRALGLCDLVWKRVGFLEEATFLIVIFF